MGSSSKRRLRRELAGVAFQFCCAGGLIVGLLIALDGAKPQPRPCAAATGRCMAEGLKAGAMPILIPSLVGLALGAAAGVAIALWIKRAR